MLSSDHAEDVRRLHTNVRKKHSVVDELTIFLRTVRVIPCSRVPTSGSFTNSVLGLGQFTFDGVECNLAATVQSRWKSWRWGDNSEVVFEDGRNHFIHAINALAADDVELSTFLERFSEDTKQRNGVF
ncbi:hypothetical protein D3C81_1669500 [compost metagenome]